MNIKPVFYGFVKDGKCKINKIDEFNRYVSTLHGEVIITIEKLYKKRSLDQNAYYWGVVIPILAEYCGYDSEEMHEALKWKYLQKQGSNNKYPTIQSTKRLNTKEFCDYIDKIVIDAAFDGIVIPPPTKIEIKDDKVKFLT